MHFLLLWFVTIILSIFIEILNEIRMIKILAEKGYKVEKAKLSSASDYLTTDIDMISMILPIVNIIHSLVRMRETFEYKNISRESLSKMYYIVPLKEEEKSLDKESFIKKNKSINIQKKFTSNIKYLDANEKNTIYFNESEFSIDNDSEEDQPKIQDTSSKIEQLRHLRETFVYSNEITKQPQKEKIL